MFVFSEVGKEDDEIWCSQMNKLQQLLDKLECQVKRKNLSTEMTECSLEFT